jgi:collagenase-like PrtC family protease
VNSYKFGNKTLENNMKLSLGPVLFFWSGEKLSEFYQQMSQTSVDIIYMGETVCSKRRSFNFEQWFDLAKTVVSEGKQVVLSTLALIEAESELKTLRRFCDNGEFIIEANDMAAVQLL